MLRNNFPADRVTQTPLMFAVTQPQKPLRRKRNCAVHPRQGKLSQATQQAISFIDMDAGATCDKMVTKSCALQPIES
jgi:hypothetical protein